MGAFNELANGLRGSTKIFKYKQMKMIELAEEHVTQDQFTVGMGGVCATLTMRWLAQGQGRISTTTDQGFQFGAVGSLDREGADGEVAQQSMETYHELKKLGTSGSKSSALKTVGKRYGLRLDVSECDDASKYAPLDSAITGLIMECEMFGNGYYIGYSVADSGGTPVGVHAVGLMGRDGKSFFFDPNIGEYQLQDADAFVVAYKQCYAKAMKWNLTKSLAYKCWVKPPK